MNSEKKVLSITSTPPITVYRNYAYPLSMICANDNREEWLISKFSNLYTMKTNDGYLWYDFLEGDTYLNDVISRKFTPLENMHGKNVINMIKEAILNENYVTFFLDEFYLKSSKAYNSRHNPGEVFIYGYDDVKKIMYSVGFNEKSTYGKVEFEYDMVTAAHNSLLNNQEIFRKMPVWVEWYAFGELSFLKEPHIDVNENYIMSLITSISDYSYSVQRNDLLRKEIKEEYGEDAVFGLNTQKVYIDNLYLLLEDKCYIDYRHIHLIYEHKKMMLNKLEYISNLKCCDIDDELNRYKKLVHEVNLARTLYLKGLISQKSCSFYEQLCDKSIIKKIIQIMENLVKSEFNILDTILRKLSL